MSYQNINLPREEILPLKLRELYEGYGYHKYRMGKFETYELYAENKQFMTGEGIITFTDATGRLMALKPDVTISIAKNASAGARPQKYYYNESIFRIDSVSRDYREINQVGIEYIGALPGYQQSEVVGLAIDSLALISVEYLLDISHMGFISALLSELPQELIPREKAFNALKRKNTDWLERSAASAGLDSAILNALCNTARFREPLRFAADKALELVVNSEMEAAVKEIRELYNVLSSCGRAENVFLDFSVVNDIDYYNGIVFQGYVRQAPRAVLAGGRYDNLMRRLGSELPAIGFALYMGELERVFYDPSQYDVDTLLICGNASPEKIATAVESIVSSGASCRAEPFRCPWLKPRKEMSIETMGDMKDA